MLTFALHSPALFRQLGVPDSDVCFQCWLTHLEYVSILMQHSISAADLKRADNLIKDHHRRLRSIILYQAIWKPKNHFACHFAVNIQRFGPPRHFWCMRFEALNQVFKQIAMGGSYRDTTRRCALFWCMRSARLRQRLNPMPWTDANILARYRTEADLPPMVSYLFQLPVYAHLDALQVEMLDTLHIPSLGRNLCAGETWIEFGADPEANAPRPAQARNLAYIRQTDGILRINGEIMLCLTLYPPLEHRLGDDSMSHASYYTPNVEVRPLSALSDVHILWPTSHEATEDGGSQWHFVRLS
jgi:hypothetical protein